MAAETEFLLRLGMQPEDVRFHAEVCALQHCRELLQSVLCSSTACNEHRSHSHSDIADTARHVMPKEDGEPASPESLANALAAVVEFLLTQVLSQHLLYSFALQYQPASPSQLMLDMPTSADACSKVLCLVSSVSCRCYACSTVSFRLHMPRAPSALCMPPRLP